MNVGEGEWTFIELYKNLLDINIGHLFVGKYHKQAALKSSQIEFNNVMLCAI